MTPLAQTQRSFVEAVADPDPAALPEHLEVALKTRFGIYRNNYFHGLSLALKDAYPRVARVVGEPFFMAAAREFLAGNPPRTRSLVLYGAEFPAFLETFPPAGSVPYLADLARLERAALEALHATDAQPLTASHLEQLGEGLLEHRFRVHPAARLVVSSHPIVALWHANGDDPDPQLRHIAGRPETALVTRPQFQVMIRHLEGADEVFIRALFDDASVTDAFAEAAAADGAFDGTSAWRTILESGIFKAD